MTAVKLRIGHGYDVHRFCDEFSDEKPLILCGVKLSDQLSLMAHSDGDVVLHAVCDAILGAIGEGDIGQHFPDTSEAFAGANSRELLLQVVSLASEKGLRLVNADVTIIAQVPKLSPYRAAMRTSLAQLLELGETDVNIKATTTEGLGYIGREEGIASHCVVLLGPAT